MDNYTGVEGDIRLDEYGNATLDTVVDAVIQERNYNILLWTPFLAIPLCIITARLIKYIYRIYLNKRYGYGDDLFDDPLAQLGLAQLGLTIHRGYDDLNDVRKIRQEQKKLERRLAKKENQKLSRSRQNSNAAPVGRGESIVGPGTNLHPLFIAENYLRSLREATRRTWIDVLSPDAVRRWFVTSRFGRLWMIFQVLATAVAIFNYVFLTYAIQRDDRKHIKILDVVLAFIFLMDYAISMYIAEDRLAFYFNPSSLVDLVSIVPPFIYVFVSESSQFVWFLGLLRILRASRILRTYRLLSFSATEEKRELTIAALSFCNFVFLAASIINALETINASRKSDPSLTHWHDSLYYIMVTFSTIGFGDLTPSSVPSRVVVMLLIVVVIIYVPIQTTRITEIFNSTSSFQRAKFSASKRHGHVILSGRIDYTTIVNFCREFFISDAASHVVVLSPLEPTLETRRLLRHPYYRNRLFYLSGTALSSQDLRRAAAQYATSMFLVNVPTDDTSNLEEDAQIRATRTADAELLMQSLVAKKHCPGLPVVAQVQDTRSEELAQACGCDRVLCIDKTKMAIVARDCLVPGFLAMIVNLVLTYRSDRAVAAVVGGDAWRREYGLGAANQIFSMRVPPGLANLHWREVVDAAYRSFNVTFFAVMSGGGRFAGRLRLNPEGEERVRDDDVVFFLSSGGSEVVVRLAIQFREPIPKEQLQLLELDAELDAKLPPVPSSVNASVESGLALRDSADTAQEQLDKPLWSNHIILCGYTTARGVQQFLSSLRAGEENDGTKNQIVCLMDEVPDESQISAQSDGVWAELVKDSSIAFVRGTPLKKTSLSNVGIKTCRRIVVFSTPASSTDSGGSQTLPDANSIFIIKMIQEEWPLTNFLVELVNGANVKYFSTTREDADWDTVNLRMLSILNNYSISISDRTTLLKKLRQRGADQESFFEVLRRFVVGSGNGGVEAAGGNQSGAGRSFGSLPFSKLSGSDDDEDERQKLTSGAASFGTTEKGKAEVELQRERAVTEATSAVHHTPAEPEEAGTDEEPSGESTAPISSHFLQKLVEEAELNESGFSPYPTHHFDRNFALGRVIPMSFAHALLAQTYFRPFLPEVIRLLALHVSQIAVPPKCAGRPYSDLVLYLLKRGFLPLGLLRGAAKWERHIQGGGKPKGQADIPTPYVYTNCRGFDIVSEDDYVFVLPSIEYK
ncbi:hypothetical protein DFJ73DRAFT_856791 [Zopfochytrium polystomum]|nr:hypothetical protein DFJ73DRAFT_856791 [Zopfochytrium polystomum]